MTPSNELTELAERIEKIDSILSSDEDAGYAAFVHMRKIWPQLKELSALRASRPIVGREEIEALIEQHIQARECWDQTTELRGVSNAADAILSLISKSAPANGANSSDGGDRIARVATRQSFAGGVQSSLIDRTQPEVAPGPSDQKLAPVQTATHNSGEGDPSVTANYAGADEIDYDDPKFNQGVQHVVYLLAKAIGSTDWVAGDGSENYDEDLEQTLLNILAAKGLYDRDEGEFAALSCPVSAEPPVAWREALAKDDITDIISELSGKLDDCGVSYFVERLQDAIDAIPLIPSPPPGAHPSPDGKEVSEDEIAGALFDAEYGSDHERDVSEIEKNEYRRLARALLSRFHLSRRGSREGKFQEKK